MSLTVPPLLIVCYFLQRYYLRTSRQVRLLSIETKAPLYQHLSETLSGVSTIRAFRRQQWLERNNLLFVDDSQKCVYTLFMIQQWLTLAMDLLACGLVVLLMILIVFSRDSFDSGSSGTAIVTLMSFTQSLARLLKFWSLTESCLGAVSRIKTFAETVPSEAQSKHSDADSSFSMHEKVTWPSQGAIEFVNVVAAYRYVTTCPALSHIVQSNVWPGARTAHQAWTPDLQITDPTLFSNQFQCTLNQEIKLPFADALEAASHRLCSVLVGCFPYKAAPFKLTGSTSAMSVQRTFSSV